MITFKRLGTYGRLGNQLFQIASTIGIANDNKTNYSFPNWSYNNYLKNPLPILEGDVIQQITHDDFCYKNFNTNGISTDIFGYLQSYKFFNKVNIKEIFELKEEHLSYRDKYKLDNSVSIHVRRTDYLSNTHVYPLLSIDYYKRAISELDSLGIKDYVVYVFSDDIEWCRDNLNFIENIYFISEYNEIVELYMMSECSHNIISNSTFSWWSAYLNKNLNKKVICPSTWFNNCDEIKNFIYDDLIPNEWIKINI
jgi:hypothetical protein